MISLHQNEVKKKAMMFHYGTHKFGPKMMEKMSCPTSPLTHFSPSSPTVITL